MNLVEDLKKSIYELIKKNKMTYQEFRDAMGYTNTDVDGILFGETLLPPIEIERIANLFGMTKKDLLYYQINKNAPCCLCGRPTDHKKSYHRSIGNYEYHYCHKHSWLGKKLGKI